MARPRIPLRLGALDEEDVELGGSPKDEGDSRLGVSRRGLGLVSVLSLAGETVNESTQPSVRDFHSNAPGVRLPNVFV